jgi:hypothetical protein
MIQVCSIFCFVQFAAEGRSLRRIAINHRILCGDLLEKRRILLLFTAYYAEITNIHPRT